MKIHINNIFYIQKKDIELIRQFILPKNISLSIIDKYEISADLNDLDFIQFDNMDDIDFLNRFDFIIDYIDFKDFTGLEIFRYQEKDINAMWRMKRECEPRLIDNNKVYTNIIDALRDKSIYHMPSREQAKSYPLEFQVLHNKISDFHMIRGFLNGECELNLPEEVVRPIHYSKKQLKKIYTDVLTDELSFDELKPIEKPLYSIFSRMDYSPEIINIIRKIYQINEYNTIDFINDDLLDLLLYLDNKKAKFDEVTMFLEDNLYTIGYNNFENFGSKIRLELNLKRIKSGIRNMYYSNSDDKFIRGLSKYNYMLSELLNTLKNSDFSKSEENSVYLNDIFLNMLVFIYFKPNVINNDFSFMREVVEYLNNNSEQVIQLLNYDSNNSKLFKEFDSDFVKYFINASILLMSLYSEKYNKKENNELLN